MGYLKDLYKRVSKNMSKVFLYIGCESLGGHEWETTMEQVNMHSYKLVKTCKHCGLKK